MRSEWKAEEKVEETEIGKKVMDCQRGEGEGSMAGRRAWWGEEGRESHVSEKTESCNGK